MSKSSKTAKLTHRKTPRNRAIVPYVAPAIVSCPVETPTTPVETPIVDAIVPHVETPHVETTPAIVPPVAIADVETVTSLLIKLRACTSPLVKKRIRAKLRVMGHRGGLREIDAAK